MAMANQPKDNNDDHNNRRLHEDLQTLFKLLYKLPTSPEFLSQRRSWGENLIYCTGAGFLAGSLSGAGKGLVDGVRASEPGDTMKLRVKRVLNASGRTGRKFGNRAGVIGLIYSGLKSSVAAIGDRDDIANSVLAGVGTVTVYDFCRVAAGVKPGVGSAALIAAGWVYLTDYHRNHHENWLSEKKKKKTTVNSE